MSMMDAHIKRKARPMNGRAFVSLFPALPQPVDGDGEEESECHIAQAIVKIKKKLNAHPRNLGAAPGGEGDHNGDQQIDQPAYAQQDVLLFAQVHGHIPMGINGQTK